MFKRLIKKFRPESASPISSDALLAVGTQSPICLVRGKGVELWDQHDKRYLDATASDGLAPLGHAHAAVGQALSLQADKLVRTGDGFHMLEQSKLAEAVAQITNMERVAFCDTRRGAITLAIQIARQLAQQRGLENGRIVRNFGAVDDRLLDQQAVRVDFNDLDAIAGFLRDPNTCAVLIQTHNLSNRVTKLDSAYLDSVRQLCDEHDCLMIVDESAVAPGLTGEWLAHQHSEVAPDIITCGAGLANGVPIAACAVRGKAARLDTLSALYGWNPGNALACHVAKTVLETIEQQRLLDNARTVGSFLKKQLQQRLGVMADISNIRAMGLRLAVELEQPHPDLAGKLLAHGLIAKVAPDDRTILLSPALIITEEQARAVAKIIEHTLSGL